jgi:hypothetical protein
VNLVANHSASGLWNDIEFASWPSRSLTLLKVINHSKNDLMKSGYRPKYLMYTKISQMNTRLKILFNCLGKTFFINNLYPNNPKNKNQKIDQSKVSILMVEFES